MRTTVVLGSAALAGVVICICLAGEENARPAKQNSPPAVKAPVDAGSKKPSPDEQAIRETAASFVKDYNAENAAGVAAHFAPDGEYVDEHGTVLQGRQAIEESLARFFKANDGCLLEMQIENVRLVGSNVALEDGVSILTRQKGELPVASHYTAVHAKNDGRWLVASVRESPVKNHPQHHEHLRQLSWLLGDWVDEGDDSLIEFSCRPVDNGHFLRREFSIKIGGQESLRGTQIIGWDPLANHLRAWTFDSHGGFCEGVWRQDGDNWTLRSTGATADGKAACGAILFSNIHNHAMTWQQVDHDLDGVRLPDSEPYRLVRRAPPPK